MSVLLHRAWEWVSGRPSAWLGMVLAIDAVIAIAGIAVGSGLNLTAMLSAGPLLACARCNGRVTGLVSAYALALGAIVAAVTGSDASVIQRERFAVIAMSGVLAIVVAMIRARRESKLVYIADKVQRAILRPLPAELGGVAFASHYQSATPGTLVGGDLYDLTMTQFGPRFIIGDVKGKGLDAVGYCAAVIGAFRELAFAEPDLTQLAELIDARISGEIGIEDFVTVILAEFGLGEVRLVNCGHHPPLKAGPSTGTAEYEIIEPPASVPPLGLHPHPAQQDVVLKQGDRLLFYTDGLVESRDRGGRFLDLDSRMAAALAGSAQAGRTLDGCVQRIAALLLEHTGHALDDDLLLVVVEPLN
jgi:phosphoserine phosphatase RsbU/P